MTDFDLIDYVVPRGGIYNVVGMDNGTPKPRFTDSLEEAHEIANDLCDQGLDVYFALSKLKKKGNRRVENVDSLRAVWLDIDCGGSKADEIEPSTGLPKGYANQNEGAQALKKFCDTVDLPEPVIVNSGYGLHVYWGFTEDIPKDKWIPIAKRFKEVCIAQKFRADPVCFEPARILRVPGTYNLKKEIPKEVKVINAHRAKRYDPNEIRELLGVDPDAIEISKPQRVMGALEKLLAQNVNNNFGRILKRKDSCLQLRDSLLNRETLSEPRWFNALSIAKFCEDGNKAIHKLSEGHPDYDYYAVENKIVGIKGPHSCAEFEKNNPSGCEGCPHKGKIKSPIVLGKIIKAAAQSPISYPKPYFRGENGGIYMTNDEGEPVFVYEHDFYLEKRMTDSEVGDVCVFKVHTPLDGIKEFIIPNTKVVEKRDLLRELAKNGVVASQRNGVRLHNYVTDSLQLLQTKRKADIMRVQFGWADNDTKFIVGEREITVDGVYHTPASHATESYVRFFEPRGTFEKWQEVFNLYNREGLEVQAFGALSGFGSPLLKLTGQKGAIINILHKNAGTGKTTVLRMANSIYGDPENLLGNPDDSAPGRINKLGIFNNIVYAMDELTNMPNKEVSALAYACSQGKGREKASIHANVNRKNNITWRTITLTTSNASFYQKLLSLKTLPDGEMMRILEFVVEYQDPKIVGVEEGREMFDLQLDANYGHAIVPFIQHVIANKEAVEQRLTALRGIIDKELNLTQRERNWSAILAANIMGGILATELGIIKFDMKRIYKAVSPVILDMRQETTAPVDVSTAVIADFLTRHLSNTLVIDGSVDQRTQRQKRPALVPHGPLYIRYEPDTKKLFIKVKTLREDLADSQTDFNSVMKDLKACGMYIDTKNCRLGTGYPIASGAERCLILNAGHEDFIDAEAYYQENAEEKDEDREGGVSD